MKTINFNLRSQLAEQRTVIMLVISIQGERIRVSTKESVRVTDWNKSTQRGIELPRVEEIIELNKRLDAIENFSIQLLELAKKEHKKTATKVLKTAIQNFIVQLNNTKEKEEFWKLFEAFVTYKKQATKSYRDYSQALRKHLLASEKIAQIPLTFSALHYRENGFIDHMKHYLMYTAKNKNGTPGLLTNTIWKQFKNLKVFINWCVEHNFIVKFSTNHLFAQIETIDHVYLTEVELKKLEVLEVSNHEKIVRDLFLISCETGLRFSDLCSLASSNSVLEMNFEVYPKKTRKNEHTHRILIPISSRVQRIITSNNGQLPIYPPSRIQFFNRTLRDLCKQAGISSSNVYYRIIQGKEVAIEQKKYELISSHTGRRTFCTLKFLAGMPSHVIMKFSGHTSEKNFLRYLKLDAELTAERYRDFF